MGTSWLGAAGAERGQSVQAACSGPGRAPVRPRVVRGELRRDAGECFGGKAGEGAFLEKGQDSCGELTTPPFGRLCAVGSSAGWCLVACPLGTAPPRVWSLELPGRLETCSGHAMCGGGMGLGVAGAEQRGSRGPLVLLLGIR